MVTRVVPAAVLVLACSAPPDPIEPQAVAMALRQRASDAPALEQALELAELGPLPIPRPDPRRADDADGSELWHLCALLYNPDVRAARAEVAVAAAGWRLSGWPQPTMGEVMNPDFDHPDRETELRLTFDVLGILGIGRAAAAEALAAAEHRAALAGLERAVWRALLAVDRARAEVAAARGRLQALLALTEEAAPGLRRAGLLHQRGWIAAAAADAAAAQGHRLAQEEAATRAGLAGAVADLARTAGLAPDAPPLARVGAATLARIAAPAAREPGDRELLGRHPELRPLLLQHAVAEAGVREAAAQAWPELSLGPNARVMPSDTLWGGMLAFRLPWPGGVAAAVDRAVAERARTRTAVEDALLAQWQRIAAAGERLRQAEEVAREHAPARDRAARTMWAAERARFAIDAEAATGWSLALAMRIEAVEVVSAAERDLALARIDLREALGPEAAP